MTSSMQSTADLNFMGAEFRAEIEFSIHDYGAQPTRDEPGWGPEFSVESITLRECRVERWGDGYYREWLGPPFEATGELFRALTASRMIDDAILDALTNQTDDLFGDYDDYDYSDL